MKKNILFFVVLTCLSMSVCAQGYKSIRYEFKDTSQRKVLFIDGKKFTGKRSDMLKYEKNEITQPVSEELALLYIDGRGAVDNQYLLIRYLDYQWEYIRAFQGSTPPTVTLAMGKFSAKQPADKYQRAVTWAIFPTICSDSTSIREWDATYMDRRLWYQRPKKTKMIYQSSLLPHLPRCGFHLTFLIEMVVYKR